MKRLLLSSLLFIGMNSTSIAQLNYDSKQLKKDRNACYFVGGISVVGSAMLIGNYFKNKNKPVSDADLQKGGKLLKDKKQTMTLGYGATCLGVGVLVLWNGIIANKESKKNRVGFSITENGIGFSYCVR